MSVEPNYLQLVAIGLAVVSVFIIVALSLAWYAYRKVALFANYQALDRINDEERDKALAAKVNKLESKIELTWRGLVTLTQDFNDIVPHTEPEPEPRYTVKVYEGGNLVQEYQTEHLEGNAIADVTDEPSIFSRAAEAVKGGNKN